MDARFYKLGENRYAYASERREFINEAVMPDVFLAQELDFDAKPESITISHRIYECSGIQDHKGWWHYREKKC